MQTRVTSRVSLVELITADVQPRSSEAVAIVAELCRQHLSGTLRAIPSAHVIRLTAAGELFVEGPIDTNDAPVRRAAELLEALLPGFDASSEYRVPGALRLVVARALGTLDLPTYASLTDFVEAIKRFGASDVRQAVRDLYGRWRQAAAMTISDVRRARRATRMPLATVARRSGIPLARVRELEWGYLRNWSPDGRSREWLTRYARVVGLDDLVLRDAVWPLIEAAAVDAPVTVLVPAAIESQELILRPHALLPPRRARSFNPWLVTAAAAALMIVVLPIAWRRVSHAPAEVATRQSTQLARPAPPDAGATGTTGLKPAERAPIIAPAAYVPSSATMGTAAFVRDNGSEAVLRITKVTDASAKDFDARPSPDGRFVAFDSDREGTRAVFVADGDGANVRRISGDGFAAMPTWSPDGSQLAYVKAEPDNPDVWNLWLADVMTKHEQRLTDYDAGESWGASWFPDGRHLAFGRGNTVMTLDLGNRTRRMLYELPHGHIRTLAVSPDGRRIVFSVEDTGAWLLDVRAVSAHRVVDDPTAENFAWGPDGRRVAFHSARSGGWSVRILDE